MGRWKVRVRLVGRGQGGEGEDVTYVPATVVGSFWQNWFRGVKGEVRPVGTGVAKLRVVEWARVIIAEKVRARMLTLRSMGVL